MFIKNKKLAGILGFILVASPTALAFAQQQPPIVPPPLGGPGPVQSPEEAISLLRQVLVWLATIFWILAVIFIFWAALNYLTARGDQEKADKAKKMLWYAIIAIAIGLIAYSLPTFVNRFLQSRA